MSRVIRGGGDSRRVVPGEVYDAREEAQRIVEQANAEAQRIVEQARERAAELQQQAHARAHESARAEAAALIAEATTARDRALQHAEEQIVQLSMAAAKRIVGNELATRPEQAREMVQEVIARARRAQEVRVRVHPDDVEAARGIEQAPGHRLTVEADPSIERGGCVVVTDVGELDARLDVQLAALERALLGERR